MYGLLSARRSRARSTCAHTHHSFRRTPALCCRRFSSMEPSTRSGSWQMPCSVEITHIHSPQSSNTCRNIGINWVWKIRYLGVRLFVEGLLWFLATKVLGSWPHTTSRRQAEKSCVFKILSLRPINSFRFHFNSYSKSQTVSSLFSYSWCTSPSHQIPGLQLADTEVDPWDEAKSVHRSWRNTACPIRVTFALFAYLTSTSKFGAAQHRPLDLQICLIPRVSSRSSVTFCL